ncbi:hypothetical protein Btru_000706 [Bulinus truncatus]|nr:hypothetical protein Btru_000706 [Bulinus truncatus]
MGTNQDCSIHQFVNPVPGICKVVQPMALLVTFYSRGLFVVFFFFKFSPKPTSVNLHGENISTFFSISSNQRQVFTTTDDFHKQQQHGKQGCTLKSSPLPTNQDMTSNTY